jgi:hypothetical protein
MSTISHTVSNQLSKLKLVTWEGLAVPDEVGSAAMVAHYSDKTVSVTGTFGSGASLTIEGSNDGVNWLSMTDPQGNVLTFTAARLEMLQENPLYVRPKLTAGADTSLTVIICGVS